MSYKKINILKKGLPLILAVLTLQSTLLTFTSCVETDSSLVEYVEDNKLNNPTDTVYSFVGIIGKMRAIADRTILLGEMRGDLTATTAYAQLDLQDLANFDLKSDNKYNDARDYYAIIQNCNYYIANVDTMLSKRGEKVFARELAVIKTYRAWTYLQLAINYGKVPFFTEPILAEKDADPSLYPMYDVNQIADYFIKDLAPNVDTKYPAYGSMGGQNSLMYYYPVRVLLGDLCLWSGRYRDAAAYYHDYLTKFDDIKTTGLADIRWGNQEFNYIMDAYASTFGSSSEYLTIIPMESEEYDGMISYLPDVFCSTENNNYFYQATRSKSYEEISADHQFCLVYKNSINEPADTIYVPGSFESVIYENEDTRGDLRLSSIYQLKTVSTNSSSLSSLRQTMQKHKEGSPVCILRKQHVYLRYAEALNRAGFPDAAFAVLKYGMCEDNLIRNLNGETVDHISASTREKAGDLIAFSKYNFTSSNTLGIHARGCGDADADTTYVIPEFTNLEDSILFVEDKICTEMALETAGEGVRFYDLIRLSLHRNDPTYLAEKVACRNGVAKRDESLYNKLCDSKNWYLKLQ